MSEQNEAAVQSNAEQEANAMMIAQCPEMFAIVKRLATVDWMSEKELSMWIRKCREIVAKIV